MLRRADAEDKANAGTVRAARFVYLAGGSVLHLRSVLKASPVWDAWSRRGRPEPCWPGRRRGRWCLGDAMVDPRGGALTLGLGLLPQLAVLPHANNWSEEKTHRTVRLASGGLRIAAIDERTALLRARTGNGVRPAKGASRSGSTADRWAWRHWLQERLGPWGHLAPVPQERPRPVRPQPIAPPRPNRPGS